MALASAVKRKARRRNRVCSSGLRRRCCCPSRVSGEQGCVEGSGRSREQGGPREERAAAADRGREHQVFVKSLKLSFFVFFQSEQRKSSQRKSFSSASFPPLFTLSPRSRFRASIPSLFRVLLFEST